SVVSARLAFPPDPQPSSAASPARVPANNRPSDRQPDSLLGSFFSQPRVTVSTLLPNVPAKQTIFLTPSGSSPPQRPIKFTVFGNICFFPGGINVEDAVKANMGKWGKGVRERVVFREGSECPARCGPLQVRRGVR